MLSNAAFFIGGVLCAVAFPRVFKAGALALVVAKAKWRELTNKQ